MAMQRLAERIDLDVALPLFTLLVTLAALSAAGTQEDRTAVGTAGWVLAPVLALLLVVRRRWPVLVLLASIAVLIGYYATGRPPVGLELPLAGAFISVAERGRLRAGIIVAVLLVIATYAFRVVDGQDPLRIFGIQLVTSAVVLAGALGTGEAVRANRRRREQERARLALTEQRREEELAHAVDTERRALAREVHDVLGHTMVVISMQADVALEALDDRATTRRALGRIKDAARGALTDIRQSLTVFGGSGEPGREPAPGVDRIPELVTRLHDSGLDVDLRTEGEPRPVPLAVGSTAYRIVQESLTNVLRHSASSQALVEVRYLDRALELRIVDHGGPTAGWTPGTGIRGMSDRAAALGGRADAAATPDGFVVEAILPLPDRHSGDE